MGEVKGKTVNLNAVGKNGKDVVVENDFSIHVEFGEYYLCYEEALENEPVFIIMQPSLNTEGYNDNGIEDYFFPGKGLYPRIGIFQFIWIGTIGKRKGIGDILEYLYSNSDDMATQMWSALASQDDNTKHLLEYDKKKVIIKDEPDIKTGYFTTNRFGATNYNLVIISNKNIYYAKKCTFWDGFEEDVIIENEKYLERLLNSVKPINAGSSLKIEEEIEQKTSWLNQETQKETDKYDSEAERLALSYKIKLHILNIQWRKKLDDYQSIISGVEFMSLYDANRSMREVINDRNEFGRSYDNLINAVDFEGKKILRDGCSSKGVKKYVTLLMRL